jgi:hypothetical protein
LTLDRVGSAWHVALQSIGHQLHSLTNLESMTRHDTPFPPSAGGPDPLDDAVRIWAFAARNASGNPEYRARLATPIRRRAASALSGSNLWMQCLGQHDLSGAFGCGRASAKRSFDALVNRMRLVNALLPRD